MYLQTNNLSIVNFRLTNSEDVNLQFQDDYNMTFKIEFYEQDSQDEIRSGINDLVDISKLNLLQNEKIR